MQIAAPTKGFLSSKHLCYTLMKMLLINLKVTASDFYYGNFHLILKNDNKTIMIGGVGAQWIKKIVLLITRSNLWSGNPFCGEYIGMVIVYKQGTFGFATMKKISVR